MSGTVIFLIIISSIFIFFSRELTETFKKFYAIAGVKLGLPLILASILVEIYDDWVGWFIIYARLYLQRLIAGLAALLPFGGNSAKVSQFLVLCFPLILIYSFRLLLNYQAIFKYKKHDNWEYVVYLGALILWLVIAILSLMLQLS